MVPSSNLEIVPNVGRRGRLISIPPLSGSVMRIQTLKDQSFPVHAARLFNCLPRSVREVSSSLEAFKFALDSFLETIPDHPKTDDLTPEAIDDSGRHSNSITSWKKERIDNLTWKIPPTENVLRSQFDASKEEICYCDLCY